MLTLYHTCRQTDSAAFLREILRRYGLQDVPILRGEYGKPRLAGDPLFFSLTHSGALTAAAICDAPVGLDAEDASSPRVRSAVLAALSPAEKAEISGMLPFYQHWTAKESYVKFCGGSIFKMYKRLSLYGGKLYLDGAEQPVWLQNGTLESEKYVFCICTAAPQKVVSEKID